MPAVTRSALSSPSGDLRADRRYEMARAYAGDGDVAAAVDLSRQAVELAPGWAAGWFQLAEHLEQAGDKAEAIEAFRRAARADATDVLGAGARLALLGAADPRKAVAPGYIAALFDHYADDFDEALIERLNYRGPQMMRAALDAAVPGAAKVGRALDLGCGTGLVAPSFRDLAERLVGIDLSPGMLALARDKALYDDLVEADIAAYLATEPDRAVGLVLAADVFVYVPEIDGVMAEIGRVLRPGGHLVFTAEIHDGPEPSRLEHTLRYTQSPAALRAAVAAAGLRLLSFAAVAVREECGEPVKGALVVAAA